ncbi:CinA family protein [Sphingorhabdus sp.]|uniref:CinA family protein n=1 Tax=Sphingorhabdus sp. TaxID=1902408 RepID=UPI00391B67A8
MSDTGPNPAQDVAALSHQLLAFAECRKLKVVTVESCTGGLLASVLTDVEGLSHVFDRAMVTYTESAKTDLAGVPAKLIAEHGVVSAVVAQAMATGGILSLSEPCLSLAITGYAGPSPDGGPAGLVYIAVASPHQIACERHEFAADDRQAIRYAAVREALNMGIALCAQQ